MDTKHSHIDKLFAKRLAHRRKELPSHMWDSIEHTLDRKRTVPLWLRWLAAAAVLFLVFGLGYEWARYSEGRGPVAGSTAYSPVSPVDNEKHSAAAGKNMVRTAPVSSGERTSLSGHIASAPLAKPVHKASGKKVPAKNTSVSIASRYTESGKTVAPPEPLFALSPVRTVEIPLTKSPLPEIRQRRLDAFAGIQIAGEARETLYSYTGEKRKAARRLAVGFSMAPSYASRDIRAITTEGVVMAEHYDGQESGTPEYAANIQFAYAANDKISLYAGIAYNTFGFQDSEPMTFALKGDVYHLRTIENAVAHYAIGKDVPASTLGRVSSYTMSSKSEEDSKQGVLTQKFSYLQFPVSVGVRLMKTSLFSTEVIGGVSPGYMVNEESEFTFEGENIPVEEYEAYNQKMLGGLFGFALNYRISRHLNIKMQPLLNYSFSSVVHNPDYEVQPYSWNLFGGIHYLF